MLRRTKVFLNELSDKFDNVETLRLAAALSFYLTFSFAPLALIFTAVAASLHPQLVVSFQHQIHTLAGPGAMELFETVVSHSKEHMQWSSLAGMIGLVSLLLSASLIFGELRGDLNKIFGVHVASSKKTGLAMIAFIVHQRLAHIGLVLSFIILLIVSLVISSTLTLHSVSENTLLGLAANLLTSFAFYTIIFGLMIRYVPDVRQPWKIAFKGGLLIAGLFSIGKELIGVYIGKSAIGSAYGAAGSGIVFLVWMYYSAIIIFIGAEISSLLSPRT